MLVVHALEAQNGEEEIRIISARKAIPRERAYYETLTDREGRQLQRLRDMPDSEIDLSDAPPVEPFPPSEIYVGRFYRPIKKLVSIRVDADVLAWFRSRGKKYQTYMNEVLRREMQSQPRSRSKTT